jgi:hypothetical protein
MPFSIGKRIRRTVASVWLRNRKRKIDRKYYGLTSSELRQLKKFEALRKKRSLNWDLVRTEISIREKKIPTIKKELQNMLDYKEMLVRVSKRNLSPQEAERIKTELQLTNIEINERQENLKTIQAQATHERTSAIKTANKIGGKK